MEEIKRTNNSSIKNGFSGILILFIVLLILIGGLIAFDFGYIAYTEKQNVLPTPTPTSDQIQTPIIAHGTFSKGDYNVNITLNFPLEGGVVSGDFSGDCSGKITGSYDSKDSGVITGKAFGSCNPFLIPIPASANFSGTVNQQQKNIFITGTGSAVGVSGSGSLTLTF